jgi:prepilin-type N-terminal cleavage/methylation domain-containing protein
MTASLPSATISRRGRGFTLTELAVVLLIVGLLLGSLMYTLSAQTDARGFADTERRLEHARELLLAFAVVHGRLPCPAVDTAVPPLSVEAIVGGICSATFNGYLPAATIGFKPTDSDGFALDAWGKRIRYAVSRTTLPADPGFFTDNVKLKAGWTATVPADIDLCKRVTAANAASCPSAADRLVTQQTVVAVLWSPGKNFPNAGGTSLDEGSNLDTAAAFVSRAPSPPGAAEGEFDDQLTWITVGELYGRLISAAKLP